MASSSNYKWLEWAKRLEAIAQTGLAFSEGVYDIERYQSLRAIAAEIMATYSNVEPSHVLDLFSQDVGYATPKVDVRAAVFESDKLLFVKERIDGCWTLPGDGLMWEILKSEVVVREVQEESGYLTRAVKLLAVYDRDKQGHPPFPYAVYRLYFLCELTGGSPSSSIETDEVGFLVKTKSQNYLFRGCFRLRSHEFSTTTATQIYQRILIRAQSPRWQTVVVEFVDAFSHFVTLEALKQEFTAQELAVVKQGNRLSVMPVPETVAQRILAMAKGTKQ